MHEQFQISKLVFGSWESLATFYLFIYLFIHLFHLFIISFIHSFIYSSIYSFIYLFIYLFLVTHKFKATCKLTTGKLQLASDILLHYLWFLEKFVDFISTCNNFVHMTILFLIQVSSWINAEKHINEEFTKFCE